jgi:hypothetical protein
MEVRSRPGRQGTEPQAFERSSFAADHQADREGVKRGRHHAVGDEPWHVILDQLDVVEIADAGGAGAGAEQDQEQQREPDREDRSDWVQPEGELLVAHLPHHKSYIGQPEPWVQGRRAAHAHRRTDAVETESPSSRS